MISIVVKFVIFAQIASPCFLLFFFLFFLLLGSLIKTYFILFCLRNSRIEYSYSSFTFQFRNSCRHVHIVCVCLRAAILKFVSQVWIVYVSFISHFVTTANKFSVLPEFRCHSKFLIIYVRTYIYYLFIFLVCPQKCKKNDRIRLD